MSLSTSTAPVYHKVSSYEAHAGTFARCLLLYSGGLDTSVMLKWIQETYRCDVYCLTINLGQTADDLEAIRRKAIMLGAKECVVYDAKDEFAEKYLSHAIKANADYQGGYALGCPLGRIMISEVAVREAKRLDCQVVAHGSTGKGNDQVRFEGYILTLNPSLKIIAPVREWGMGRDEEIAYAIKHNIPIKQKAEVPYSWDENAWSNTGEGGEIENPELIPKLSNILQWCKTIENAAPEGETVEIEFYKGIPIALNGEKKKLYSIIADLNRIGGKHGVGVFQLIEDRVVGLKVRGVYENPAASILIAAHKKLEYLVSTREENEFSAIVQNKWAYLTYGAKWFDPLMDHLRAFIDDQNEKVTGTVSVKLYRGNIIVESLKSPYSLFNHNLATFNRSAAFNQNASPGFIELYTLAMRTAQGVKEKRLLDEKNSGNSESKALVPDTPAISAPATTTTTTVTASPSVPRPLSSTNNLMHLLSIDSLRAEEIRHIVWWSYAFKHNPRVQQYFSQSLAGRTIVMMFEKPSLRTRLSFEVAATQLGGHAIYYPLDMYSNLGQKESVEDTARCIARYGDVLMMRLKSKEIIAEMAKYSSIPCINGLDDNAHPCQILADLLTIYEEFEAPRSTTGTHAPVPTDLPSFRDIKLAYIGSVANNVAYDLMRASAILDFEMRVAGPVEETEECYRIRPDVLTQCDALKTKYASKSSLTVTSKPQAAVSGAHVVVTDTWSNYGTQITEEAKQTRSNILRPYQVTDALMSEAASNSIFMHCLPAKRGEEVVPSVIDGPRSRVFPEAENRLHAQKAVVLYLMGKLPLNAQPWNEVNRL